MTPEEFLKSGIKTPDDLIGKARSVAQIFCAKAKSNDIAPIRLLFYGQPGIGKSAVCRLIANTLSVHPYMIHHVSAGQLSVEKIREWMEGFQYVNEAWGVFWIEEVDAVNPAVEVLLLQFLDELPTRNAVLVTSNEQMSGISGRFTSRCKAIRFAKPSVDEVETFLMDRWPELKETAREIAESNNGDVRASLNDAQMALDVDRYTDKPKEAT